MELCVRSGYNMIHFTPIQRLGNSNSAYSLSDQLRLNTTFSSEDGIEASLEDVGAVVETMREEWGMMSICDIVLNHTANETPWLQHYPEVTVSPQLIVRYLALLYLRRPTTSPTRLISDRPLYSTEL